MVVGGQLTQQKIGDNRKRLNISKYAMGLSLIWRKSYGEEGEINELGSATILPDGSIVAVGTYGLAQSQSFNGVILKVNSKGVPEWMREYDHIIGTKHERFYGIDQTLDGGFIVVGDVTGEVQGKAWVVKTNSLGCTSAICPPNGSEVLVDSLLLDPKKPRNPDTSTVSLQDLQPAMAGMILYPNPAKSLVEIRLSIEPFLLRRAAIRIYNSQGLLYRELQPALLNTVDLREAESGLYLVQLIVEGHVVQAKKLLKE